MIIGIVAAARGNPSAAPYAGASGIMDFMTGDYWIGGTQVNAAEVIDHPDYITANGLSIVDTQPGPTQIIGQFLALLTPMSWTMVLEWLDVYAADTTTPIWMQNTQTVAYENTWLESQDTRIDFFDQPIPGNDRQVTASGLTAEPVIRRIALTRTDAKFAMSLDGGAVTSDNQSAAVTGYDAAAFGGEPGSSYIRLDTHIRRLIVYPEQSDAALPGLSTQ